MLKEFWEDKKHIIQLVGILAGVGALFLSIAPPDNVEARQALANIQLVWLIIISLSCGTLFISFHNFFIDLEKHYSSKWSIDLKETISLIIFLSLFYIISNLWIYIIKLYSIAFWNYIQSINLGIMAVLGSIFFHFFRKVTEQIENYYKRISFVVLAYTLLSILVSSISLIINYKGVSFPLWQWLLVSVVFFFLLIIMTIYEENRRKIKKRN